MTYDKDRARRKYLKWKSRHPDNLPFQINAVMIKQIVDMYETVSNQEIAKTLKLKYTHLISVLNEIRKNGIELPKKHRKTAISSTRDAIEDYKLSRHPLTEEPIVLPNEGK